MANEDDDPPPVKSDHHIDNTLQSVVRTVVRRLPGMFDHTGRQILDGDLLLHGDSYLSVSCHHGDLGVAYEGEFERLTQPWCDCVAVVGSDGVLQEP